MKPMIFYVDIIPVYPGIFVASDEEPRVKDGQYSTSVKVIEYAAYEALLKKLEEVQK